jgi:phage shock protein E
MIIYAIIAAVVLFFVIAVWKMRPDISGNEAKALVQSGARLIDVRSASEFAGGSLPKAKNIPVSELKSRIGELGKKSKAVVVFCQSGGRSAAAKRTLLGAGFETVRNLGGLHRWS